MWLNHTLQRLPLQGVRCVVCDQLLIQLESCDRALAVVLISESVIRVWRLRALSER